MKLFGQRGKGSSAFESVVVIRSDGRACPPAITAETLRDMVACVKTVQTKIPTLGCVAASAAIHDVLLSCGIDAECLSVAVMAINSTIFKRLRLKLTPSDPGFEIELAATGIGEVNYEHLDTDDRWHGHLVTVVNGYWLVDATLDQFEDSQKGIVLRPVVAGVAAGLLKRGGVSFRFGNSFVIYTRSDERQGYREGASWYDRASRMHGFSELTKALLASSEGSAGRRFIERHLDRRRRLDSVYKAATSSGATRTPKH